MIPNFDGNDDLSLREILDPAMEIASRGDRDEAGQYLDAYVRYLLRRNDWSPEEALRVALSNVGYGAGYYGREDMQAVKDTFGAAHPVFG